MKTHIGLVTLVNALLQARASASGLRSFTNARAACLGSRYYWMGGNYTQDNDDVPAPDPRIFYIDLNSSFSTSSLDDSIHAISIPSNLTPTISQQVNSLFGSVFYDNDTIYLFGGFDSWDTRATNVLPAFHTSSQVWDTTAVAGGNFSRGGENFPGLMYAGNAPEFGLSFAFGSHAGNDSSFIRLDLSDPTNLSWTNRTKDSRGSTFPKIGFGSDFTYVPYGEKGVLVNFGGGDLSGPGTEYNDGWYDDMDMSLISVYDIATDVWYNVTATGDIPTSLNAGNRGYCTAVSRAPDSSSFNIVKYGGWSQFAGVHFVDVYVLSIPSFRWIQISDKYNPGSQGDSCTMWNDRQLIVLGGGDYPSVKVLDVGTFQWSNDFDPSLEGYVADNISSIIGGNSSGNAVLLSPSGGFNQTDLAAIFATPLPRVQQTSSPSPSAAPSRPSTGVSGGVKAGIIVGALVFITAFISVLVFCRKRKQKAASKNILHNMYPVSAFHGESGPLIELPDSSRAQLDGTSVHSELQGDGGKHELVAGTEIRHEMYGGYHGTELENSRNLSR